MNQEDKGVVRGAEAEPAMRFRRMRYSRHGGGRYGDDDEEDDEDEINADAVDTDAMSYEVRPRPHGIVVSTANQPRTCVHVCHSNCWLWRSA
jgi:hypothetical protein